MSPPKTMVRFTLKHDGRKQRFRASKVSTLFAQDVLSIIVALLHEVRVLQGYLRGMKNFKVRSLGFSNQCTSDIQHRSLKFYP